VRIATYNVNYGQSGHPRTVAAIAALDADALFLQETTPAWERALRGLGYPHARFRHWRPGRAGGHGLLARWPVAAEEVLDAPTGWFPAWRVLLDAPAGRLQALAVHLRPWFSVGRGFHRSFFATHEVRRLEIETYLERLDPRLPTIVLGDFNEADGPALACLRARGYRQATSPGHTWRFWRWRRVYDHLFCGPGIEAADAAVVAAGASDHLPLTARIAVTGS
jgi:endonuclease/exonuclease/phosphatase family metal-dependent hydrolase